MESITEVTELNLQDRWDLSLNLSHRDKDEEGYLTEPEQLQTLQTKASENTNFWKSTTRTSLAIDLLKTSSPQIFDPTESATAASFKGLTTFNDMKGLLRANRQWAKAMISADTNYFQQLSLQHTPKLLWIGCADSRVPANQIVSLRPGEIFVHRNIANCVLSSDVNCMAVLQYAVEVLKVEHVMIVGHYGCGGVNYSIKQGNDFGVLDLWLQNLKDIYFGYKDVFEQLSDEMRSDLLCELNVSNSVLNVSRSSIMQHAWAKNQNIAVHGLVYRITDGILHDLNIRVAGGNDIGSVEDLTKERKKPMF